MSRRYVLLTAVVFVLFLQLPQAAACTVPVDGGNISTDTTFCRGTYNITQGLFITSDFVDLDGNGSTLIGDNGYAGVIIEGALDSVTVKNFVSNSLLPLSIICLMRTMMV